jgi:predicted RNase H-like HicB family nuclease
MKTIEAIIERAEDGTFDVYCTKEIFSGAGKTIDEAKEDMQKQMAFYKKTAIEEGFRYPNFLDEPFEINYTVDSLSLMKYYVQSGMFSLSGMEKVTGINQKQLWSYLHGTKPRKKQLGRIETGILSLRKDLNAMYA